MPTSVGVFGPGPVGLSASNLALLPPPLREHVGRLRKAVYVYELPARVSRESETWSTRYWGDGSFEQCDPVHMRRIYQAQSHFAGHLLHDDYVRTLDPREAKLFYVPTLLSSRITWGGQVRARDSTQRAAHNPEPNVPLSRMTHALLSLLCVVWYDDERR